MEISKSNEIYILTKNHINIFDYEFNFLGKIGHYINYIQNFVLAENEIFSINKSKLVIMKQYFEYKSREKYY